MSYALIRPVSSHYGKRCHSGTNTVPAMNLIPYQCSLRSFLSSRSVRSRFSQLSPRASTLTFSSSGIFNRQSHWITLSDVIPCRSASCFLVRVSRTSSSFSSIAYARGLRKAFFGFMFGVSERLRRRMSGVSFEVRVY
jgi:hypothetical protein